MIFLPRKGGVAAALRQDQENYAEPIQEIRRTLKVLNPPSRASKTPDRARKLYTRGDSMKQDILTKNHPIVKQTRHKTSTWPSLQHKLWLYISNFPLHQLRENKRMRNEGNDIQRLRGGRIDCDVELLHQHCGSYTQSSHCQHTPFTNWPKHSCQLP